MFLSFGLGDCQEVLPTQAQRMGENWPRHDDFVVICESANDINGGVVDKRESGTQLGKDLGFYFSDQKSDDLVKNLDLVLGQLARTIKKEVRHPPQHLAALFRRSALERVLNLGEQGSLYRRHSVVLNR